MLATPKRWMVMLLKVAVAYVGAVIISIVVHLGAVSAFAIRGVDMSGFFSGHTLQQFIYTTLGSIIVVTITQAIGWITRSTALTTTIMIVLALGIDNAVAFIPKVGEHLQPLLLINNANALFSSIPINGYDSLTHSWIVVLCWVAVALGASTTLVHTRDV